MSKFMDLLDNINSNNTTNVKTDKLGFELNETSLSRAYQHIKNYDVAFISACRGAKSYKENLKNSKELKSRLMTFGYLVTKVGGGFIENQNQPDENPVEERTYFVVNVRNTYEKFEKDIVALGVYYEQDAVIVGKKGGLDLTQITTNNNCDTPKFSRKVFKNISYGKIDLFYTRFKHNTLVLQEQQDCLKIDGFDTLRYHGFSGARMVYSGCKEFDNTKFNDIFNSIKV
jgi:hypothetical protein